MDSRMLLAGKRFLQRLYRARFANPSLADQRSDLAFARLRQSPAIEQQPHFMRPADERQSAAGAACGKAAFDGGFAAHLPSRDRAAKTFQLVLAGVGKFEKAT